jgi:chemotaxis protein methyltransferase CheR
MELPIPRQVGLSEEEYTLFANLVYSLSGINLGDNKKEMVKARLMKRMRVHGFTSYRQYYDFVLHDSSGEEIQYLLNAISTNVTSFFREMRHFDFMTQTALPEIVERKRRERSNKIRIWSSASSTGEEIYSILMTVMDFLGAGHSWDVKILGTDISTQALQVAQQGAYYADKVKGVPLRSLDRYFDKIKSQDGIVFRVKEQFRRMTVFGKLNLMRESYPFQGKFDIIFCRNVMIYFDKQTQHNLVMRLCRYLDEDGYLLIGHSESLMGADLPLKNVSTAIYKKTSSVNLSKRISLNPR